MRKTSVNSFYHGTNYSQTCDHDHTHEIAEHHHKPLPPSKAEIVSKAIESLLIEKGIITHDAIERATEWFKNDIGPMLGAKVVAKAWKDPEFKKRLLEDGTKAIGELNISGFQTEYLVVKENKPGIHNVVVCTLCSCYPWALLGLPPSWYKSYAYRSRVVMEPREVLKDFGVFLDESVEIHVWDANAEIRYMILPEQPPGTEHMTEEELAEIVTRDSMVGVGFPISRVTT